MVSLKSLKTAGITGLLALTLASTGNTKPAPVTNADAPRAPYTTQVQDGYALVSKPELTSGYSAERAVAVRELAKLLLTKKHDGLVQTKEQYWQGAEFYTQLPGYQVSLKVFNANEQFPIWQTTEGPKNAPADYLQIYVFPTNGETPFSGVTHGLTGNWRNGSGELSGPSRQAIDSVVNALVTEFKR